MVSSTTIPLKILAFGITKDILGASAIDIKIETGASVADLKTYLIKQYPKMEELRSLLIAVNNEYGDDTVILKSTDDIALIPPVSGG